MQTIPYVSKATRIRPADFMPERRRMQRRSRPARATFHKVAIKECVVLDGALAMKRTLSFRRICFAALMVAMTVAAVNFWFHRNDGIPCDLRRGEMIGLAHAIDEFKRLTGHVPTSEEGLKVLVERKLIAAVPLDAWGRSYRY